MSKIIVGYDGREGGRDALSLGARLAGAYGDDLVVTSVFGHDQQMGPGKDYSDRRRRGFTLVRQEVRDALGGRDFEHRLFDDTAAHALHELARTIEARAVVLGSTHRSTLGRVILGTVGESMLSGSPAAVVVAPRGYSDGPHAEIGLIGVAFDGNPESDVALLAAADLASRTDSELEVITVGPSHGAVDSHLGPVEAIDEEFRGRLHAAKDLAGRPVKEVYERGDTADVLAARGVELDLLIIGSRGYGPVRRALLGSVGARLLNIAPCPVMVVPRSAEDGVFDPAGAADEQSAAA
jgi:nucleotide-binding universal stress UspA family protein